MDVIARPVVVPRVRACSTWGLLPVPSSLFLLVGGGTASESSEEVRVVLPSPTAGCSLDGGITSVSWPAVGGVAGVAASAAGSGVKLCPSTSVGGAVTVGAATADPAGASGPPPAPAAVPGSIRRLLTPVGVTVACQAMGLTDARRSVQGVGLLPLDLLLVVGSGTIALPRALLRKIEPLPFLPELDMRLRVHLAIFAPLQQMTARRVLDLRVGRRCSLREQSIFVQALRMTTGLVPLIRLTLTGMTPSGQSWASSGAFMAWKSLQGSHRLGARHLLHRSMV